MEIAQEEVLTCIGMCIYNRLKRVQQCVKEEENACQVLGAVAVYALCRSFDMAVENKRGVNLELIYDEISRDEKIKEAKKEQKKLKKRKKKNEKKMAEEGGHGGCDPEPVSDKCACTADDNHGDDYDDEDGHSGHSNDEDDDSDEKIVLCDGTIIDVGPSQGCKKGTAGGGGGNGGKLAQSNNNNNHNQENHHPNHNNHAHHQNNNPNHQQNHHTCSDNSNNSNLDAVSVTSCHSCNNETDGPCTQRSIDAGYESHHDSGSCCLSSNSNNNSSRTSSIASTPEGSEVACSDLCCNNSENKLNKRNLNNGHCGGSAANGDGKCTNGDSGLVMSLEQMLLVSTYLDILLFRILRILWDILVFLRRS